MWNIFKYSYSVFKWNNFLINIRHIAMVNKVLFYMTISNMIKKKSPKISMLSIIQYTFPFLNPFRIFPFETGSDLNLLCTIDNHEIYNNTTLNTLKNSLFLSEHQSDGFLIESELSPSLFMYNWISKFVIWDFLGENISLKYFSAHFDVFLKFISTCKYMESTSISQIQWIKSVSQTGNKFVVFVYTVVFYRNWQKWYHFKILKGNKKYLRLPLRVNSLRDKMETFNRKRKSTRIKWIKRFLSDSSSWTCLIFNSSTPLGFFSYIFFIKKCKTV